MALSCALGVVYITWAMFFHGYSSVAFPIVTALVGLVELACTAIFFLFIYYMWAAIQDGGHARTTPAKAVGFLFIPIFNIYWSFQVWWGFAKDYNAFVEERAPNTPRLSEWLCLAFCIFSLLIYIPLVPSLQKFAFLAPVFAVVSLMQLILFFWTMSSICNAVNALPADAPGDYGQAIDTVFKATMLFCGLSVLAVLGLIVYELMHGSTLSWHKFGLKFFSASDWDPERESFGALPFIYGTLVSSLLALIIAVPLSIGVAVFTTEMCPRVLRGPLSFFVELLAAIPSVVYGLWGFLILAPRLANYVQPFLADHFGPKLAEHVQLFLTAHIGPETGKFVADYLFGWTVLFSGPQLGISMFAAGIILAIMIIPIISSITKEVLLVVPQNQREAVLALGATRWEMIRVGVLRNARAGIAGGIILGLGRALGETMAVTMVIGNAPQIKHSLFEFGYTMASVLANEFSEASADMHLSALIEIGLALFLVTIIVNALARLLVWTVTRGQPARGNV
jgi:phosphate transport system permease protein